MSKELQTQNFDNIRFMSPKVVYFPRTYEIDYDINDAKDRKAKIVSLEDYRREKNDFLEYTGKQMETLLGERFNVTLSKFEYEIKDGQMWGKNMKEPFIKSIKRGRDIRKNEGNSVDFAREDAEVTGFEKIQAVLTNPTTPIGTIMLSVSPPGKEGSAYKHNFVDGHTLKIDKNSKRYIESRRWSSPLSIQEYKDKLSVFTNIKIDDNDPAASFLANPIKISKALMPEDIHKYLLNEYQTLDEEIFGIIVDNCKGLIGKYGESVFSDPNNLASHKEIFNSIVNKADEIEERIKSEGKEKWKNIRPLINPFAIEQDIAKYSRQPVREVATGCGFSGGYEAGQRVSESPFSVVDFMRDKYGERTFKCPSCKKENVRPFGKLLPVCSHCGSDEVAC